MDRVMTETVTLDYADADRLGMEACLGAGASQATARSLMDATMSAASKGQATLGFPHLVDYLNSFKDGRIKGNPSPRFEKVLPAYFTSDADSGIAQLGFDLAFQTFVEAIRQSGIAIFTQKNSYTTGELGYYVRRLAERGIVGLAATNASAMVVAKPKGKPVFSTNPIAFSFPLGKGNPPLVIDQSSSATAFVNVVAAAREGRVLPEGWAVDEFGNETTDAEKAMVGALLPFGGRKGANIALMVEMLSAGLSGGNWSLDVADFRVGTDSPAVGLTIIGMLTGLEENTSPERAARQIGRLEASDVYIPGVSGRKEGKAASPSIEMPKSIHDAVMRFALEKR